VIIEFVNASAGRNITTIDMANLNKNTIAKTMLDIGRELLALLRDVGGAPVQAAEMGQPVSRGGQEQAGMGMASRAIYIGVSLPLLGSPVSTGEWATIETGWSLGSAGDLGKWRQTSFLGIEFGGGTINYNNFMPGLGRGRAVLIGGGLNAGRGNRFLWGGSIGFWTMDTELVNTFGINYEDRSFLGFGGPFLKYRWPRGFELTYRALIGYGEEIQYRDNISSPSNSGFRSIHRFNIGFRPILNRKGEARR
jgi:hypothetical protein